MPCYTILSYPILYYTLLYYILLSLAVVEMTPNSFQEVRLGIQSRNMVLYCTQLTCTILYSAVLYCIIFCSGGDGIQSLSRRWIWHPTSLHDTILYSIDKYYTILCYIIFVLYCIYLLQCGRWHLIPFKKLGFGLPSHYMVL